ncbi:hypothetical protein H0R92_13420 [Treponema sp. OMZ 840]|uniref:hypothetical protein n=1 Tax=Treponema sp. OMZ 840 TaxID=244313 RepID=UPI003D8CA853
MRRIKSRSAFYFFVFFTFFSFAEINQASVIPKEVYVGDEAEIRFEFSFVQNLFGKNTKENLIESKTVSANLFSLPENAELKRIFFSEDYTIQKMRLSGSGTSYVLSIFFVPWKNGEIDISAFDLASVLAISVRPLVIDIPPVYIQSIIEKTGEKKLRPVHGPIIIPGTTYIIFAVCAAAILCAAVLTAVLIRFPRIRGFLTAFFERMFSSGSFRSICRELLLLEKKAADLQAAVFCTRLSLLIRTYLENRFAYPFTAKTSAELVPAFSEFFAYSASTQSYEYIQNLYEVCIRCDYIRFSEKARSSAGDKDPDRTDFPVRERIEIVNKVRSALLYFEQPEEPSVRETI